MTAFVSICAFRSLLVRCTSATFAYSTINKSHTQVRMQLVNEYSELSSTLEKICYPDGVSRTTDTI